jgi:phage/plasmid-associated DNA primase
MEETLDQIERDNDSLKTFVNDNMARFDEQTEIVKDWKDINQIHQIYSEFEQREYGTPPERVMTIRKFFKVLRNRGFKVDRLYSNNTQKKSYFILGWRLRWEAVEKRFREDGG